MTALGDVVCTNVTHLESLRLRHGWVSRCCSPPASPSTPSRSCLLLEEPLETHLDGEEDIDRADDIVVLREHCAGAVDHGVGRRPLLAEVHHCMRASASARQCFPLRQDDCRWRASTIRDASRCWGTSTCGLRAGNLCDLLMAGILLAGWQNA